MSFGRHSRGGKRVVAGYHDGLDAHLSHFGEPLLDAAFYNIVQADNAQHLCAFRDNKGGGSLPGDVIHDRAHLRRKNTSLVLDIFFHRVGRALADLPAVQVHSAHSRLSAELHEMGAQGMDVPFPEGEFFLGQYNDAPALRCFVGQG